MIFERIYNKRTVYQMNIYRLYFFSVYVCVCVNKDHIKPMIIFGLKGCSEMTFTMSHERLKTFSFQH